MSTVSSSSLVSSSFLVLSLSRTCWLVVRCWLGCRSRGDRDRGSCWLLESAGYEAALPFRVVFRRGEAGRVPREVVAILF